MQKRAREILQWDRQAPNLLPDNAIVISTDSQDTGFAFFRLGEGDNPPVYYYPGTKDQVEKDAESFTTYLGQLLRANAKIHKIHDQLKGINNVRNFEDVQRLVREFIGTLMNSFFVGCSAAEIDTLEMELGLTLPVAYKTFLRVCGHHAVTLWEGKSWQYKDIVKIQSYPRATLLEYNLPLAIPPMAFVCSYYSAGSGFTFFDLKDGADPLYMNFSYNLLN